MKKEHVKLRETDRTYLKNLVSKGPHAAKIYKRALALLDLDRGQTYTRTAEMVSVSIPTVISWAANYKESGLGCLQDKPRSGRPVEIDGAARRVWSVDIAPPG